MWIVGSQPRIAIRQAATTIEFPPQTSQNTSDHSLDRQPTAPMNSWINVLDRAGRLERNHCGCHPERATSGQQMHIVTRGSGI
jgi:hypothetical protein